MSFEVDFSSDPEKELPLADQTPKRWKATLAQRTSISGTGIIALAEKPHPERKRLAVKSSREKRIVDKELFMDITCADFKRLARQRAKEMTSPKEGLLIMKWIPNHVATFDLIAKSDCKGQGCKTTCVVPGCVCAAGVCR